MTSQSSGGNLAEGGDLTEFISIVAGERHLRVEESLGGGFVRLRVAEAERRQAKHDIRCVEDIVIEMLRNSRDAGATRVYVATGREGTQRTITVLDDGEGIPPGLHGRIFDARVTSKLDSMHEDRWGVHGRGMALFSIRENARDARVMDSAPGLGSAIRVVADVAELPERTDQSSWPTLGADDGEEGSTVVRGPHNIVRTCCEFALEEHGRCEVYLGSAAEIVATACARVRPSIDAVALARLQSLSGLAVLERFGAAADAAELAEVARSTGLDISPRTAQRILSGEVVPLRSVYLRLVRHDVRRRTVNLERDRRGLRLADADAKHFAQLMRRDFDFLAERYYLRLVGSPRMRVGNGRLIVSFDIEDDD